MPFFDGVIFARVQWGTRGKQGAPSAGGNLARQGGGMGLGFRELTDRHIRGASLLPTPPTFASSRPARNSPELQAT